MTSENQHITDYYAGDSLHIYIDVTDDEGEVVPLAEASATWILHKRGEVFISKDTTDGITITDAANGEMRVEIDPEDTENLDGVFKHRAKVTDALGERSTTTVGRFEIDRLVS